MNRDDEFCVLGHDAAKRVCRARFQFVTLYLCLSHTRQVLRKQLFGRWWSWFFCGRGRSGGRGDFFMLLYAGELFPSNAGMGLAGPKGHSWQPEANLTARPGSPTLLRPTMVLEATGPHLAVLGGLL